MGDDTGTDAQVSFFSRCFLRLVANEMLKGDLACALDDG
jgi:hypothetical protein